ncbi:hypothetical protein [Flaviaesturariibacter amylovorans]|uniref:Uncharacterized protein n=1 Tax=Flaviaesturariibacter amylovorans TaxID=1084520 RepID=A0ABP8HSU2_9BACT
MSLFQKLFGGLLGRDKTPKNESIEDLRARWEQEAAERTAAVEASVRGWLVDTLRRQHRISFAWESGGDEGFINFPGFNKEEEDRYCELEEYLMNKLDIPSAGEFQMTGRGTLFLTDGVVRAKYSSEYREVVDFDEVKDEEVYGEPEVVEDDRILFAE